MYTVYILEPKLHVLNSVPGIGSEESLNKVFLQIRSVRPKLKEMKYNYWHLFFVISW